MNSRQQQRGFSFLGMLFVGGIVACLFVVGAQLAPTAIEFMAIKKAANKAANEASSVADVRKAFDRAAAIDNISSITGNDLDVTKAGDKIVVSFAYDREIHLTGPAYLVMKYAGKTK
jgi:type II secretory pathway pseudopilin PulG